MSKLTSEKQPKKLMNGLFGSFRKNKSKVKINLDVESQQDNNGTMSFDVVVKVINGESLLPTYLKLILFFYRVFNTYVLRSTGTF